MEKLQLKGEQGCHHVVRLRCLRESPVLYVKLLIVRLLQLVQPLLPACSTINTSNAY